VVDRNLVGVIGIALVIATVISVITFQVREEDPIQLLAQQTPGSIPSRYPGSYRYSFDLIASRDLPDVLIRCYFLQRLPDPVPIEPWDIAGSETGELLDNIPLISQIKDYLDPLTSAPAKELDYRTYEVEDSGKRTVFIDFTDIIAAIAGEHQLQHVYTIYALELGDGDDPRNVSFYGGIRDFFFNRSALIAEISYSTPTESGTFRSETGGAPEAGTLPVDKAPMGEIHLHGLPEGQRAHFEVSFVIDRSFDHRGMIRLVEWRTGHGAGPSILDRIGSAPT
jgi:hypothetical protein